MPLDVMSFMASIADLLNSNSTTGGQNGDESLSGNENINLTLTPQQTGEASSHKRTLPQDMEASDGKPSKATKADSAGPALQVLTSHDIWKRYHDLLEQQKLEKAELQNTISHNQQLKKELEDVLRLQNRVKEAPPPKPFILSESKRKETIPEALKLRVKQLSSENLKISKDRNDKYQAYTELQQDFRNLKVSQGKKQNDLDAMAQELTSLKAQLEACKLDLFRKKPAVQIPDSVIINDFDFLCDQITGWIDGEVYKFTREHPGVIPQHIFSPGNGTGARHLAVQYPEIGEHLVRHTVHRCLGDSIFDQDVYHLALSQDQNEFMQDVEEAMRSQTPPKGKIRVS